MFAAQFMFPNIHTILKVLLTMPISAASAERSFSGLRRLKTYLRRICQKHVYLVWLCSTSIMRLTLISQKLFVNLILVVKELVFFVLQNHIASLSCFRCIFSMNVVMCTSALIYFFNIVLTFLKNPAGALGVSPYTGVTLTVHGVQGYSDNGGIGVTIHGWFKDCQSNSGVWRYSDMGGKDRSAYPRKVHGLSE